MSLRLLNKAADVNCLAAMKAMIDAPFQPAT